MHPASPSLAKRELVLRAARVAGVLYVAIIALGLCAELAVRGELIVRDDPVGTARAIAADPGLWRLGILADVLMVACDVAVAWLLFIVMSPTDRALSGLAAAFRLAHAAILGASTVLLSVPAFVLDGPLAPDSFGEAAGLSYAAAELHRYGYLIALVLFAVHLAVLGVVVCRSSYLPRWLGWLLEAAAAGYLVDSWTHLLVGGYDGGFSAVALTPAVAAEVALAGWLVFRGIDRDGWSFAGDGVVPDVEPGADDEVGYWEEVVDKWSGATERHPSSNRFHR
jgi:hypothetical protein